MRLLRSGSAQCQHLVVMLKVPVAGRVKTRLARGLGVIPATAFYRLGLAALLSEIDRPSWWTTVLAVTPDADRTTSVLPRHLTRVGQGRGNLGDRMQRAIDALPQGPVVLIGTDVPGLRAQHIRQAFAALRRADAVIGPSPDGGYWLIGFNRRRRQQKYFEGVRWSSADARTDTLRNLQGLQVLTLETLADIDTVTDLKAAGGRTGRRIPPHSPISYAAD